MIVHCRNLRVSNSYLVTPFFKITEKRLELGNARIGTTDRRSQHVGAVPGRETGITEMPRHTDLLDHLSVHTEWFEARGDQGYGFDRTTLGRDAYLVTLFDALLFGQRFAHFDEHIGHQLV